MPDGPSGILVSIVSSRLESPVRPETVFIRRKRAGGANETFVTLPRSRCDRKTRLDYAGLQIEGYLWTGTCPRRQRPREIADEDPSRVPVALSDFE